MKRHEMDAVSVFFGTIFAFVGGMFLFTDVDLVDIRWNWGLPLFAFAAGLLFLVAAIRRTRPISPSQRDGEEVAG